METAKEKGKDILERAMGDIVECVDVDGIVRRIDVNDVVQRIDIDALVQKIDINALLQKVDINALLDRSDLAAIVAQSSSGVFGGIMDNLRFQIVRVDLFLLRLFQRGAAILPPAPGMVDQHVPFPKTTTQKAVAVQLRYCGIFSKTMAFAIDSSIIFIAEVTVSLVVDAALKRINQLFLHLSTDKEAFEQKEFLAFSMFNAIFAFCYIWISIALMGQTLGTAVVGIRVVNTNGDQDVSPWRAALRTLFLIGTVLVWPFCILVGLYRRDGRLPHDIIAHTGMIFKWDARMARLREKAVLDDDDSSVASSLDAQQESNVDTTSIGSNTSEPKQKVADKTDDANKDERSKIDKMVSDSKTKESSNLMSKTNVAKSSKKICIAKPSAVKDTEESTAIRTRSMAPPPMSVQEDSQNVRKNRASAKSTDVTQSRENMKSTAVLRTMVLAPGEYEDESVETTASACKTSLVLNEGRRDLRNTHPPGVIGFFFNPVRNMILEPTLAIASAVVPQVVRAVPFGDEIAAAGLRIPFQVARAGYSLIPFRQDVGDVNLALVAQNDILCTTGAGSKAIPQLTASDSLQSLILLSRSLGIRADNDLDEAILQDLYGGRLLCDMRIFHKIQEESDQRIKVKKYEQSQIEEEINTGSMMMKFATAAYGTGMLHCALGGDTRTHELERIKKEISQYVDIDEDDIKLICMNEGNTMKLLRHFVAIDRKRGSVVLAIRGSLPVSGAVIDMQAEDSK